jgi:2-polyprenyl-3-methyl-5-hydroxy-6-metoxy-1,4-benzoquinol methylase
MRPSSSTLLVWSGGPCSNGCGSCPIDQSSAEAGLQAAEVQHGLAGAAANGSPLVVLVGGEPILRPALLRMIGAIHAAGCVPGLVTTGRPLLYPQVRARLQRSALEYMRVQLFGIDDVHDRATAVPGGFDQALGGLRAWLAEAGKRCDVDVVLNLRQRPPHGLVADVERLAREVASTDVQIVVAVDPSSIDTTAREESLRQALIALENWNDDPTRPLLAWEGLPQSMRSPSLTTASMLPAFVARAPRACCLGTVSAMATATTAGRPQPQANSFNFVRTAVSVPWTTDAETCTAYSASASIDRWRHLWLVENRQLVLYDTDTGDFAASQIERIKEDWSHLFLDRAPAGVLDDFTEGMRRVLPEPTCRTCVHRSHCGRRFEVVEGPPFAREEAWIASYIAGLRGRVLDVGCGEQLYQKELAPLLSSGAVEYIGLDPDEPSLIRIRAALPEGRFYLEGIEDFRDEPETYDTVLCLRSLNHLNDVDEGLARMAHLLKPGGSLLIVETTPFAMLRRREQIAAADTAPRGGHQHYRNLTSLEVVPLARRRGLHVTHHHPAGLHTTNEWILLLERAQPGTASE